MTTNSITIKHIVFDIGRVLVEWDAELPFLHLIPDAKERNWFLSNVCSPDWNIEQDRGRTWSEAEQVLIAQFPEHEQMIRAYRLHWHKMVAEPVAGSFEIMHRLIETGHDVTLLTNFSAETYPQALKMHPGLKTRAALRFLVKLD